MCFMLRANLAVEHGRAEANDKNSEVSKADALVIVLPAADDHAV